MPQIELITGLDGNLDVDAQIDAVDAAGHADSGDAVLHLFQLAGEIMSDESFQGTQGLGDGLGDGPRFADLDLFAGEQSGEGQTC